MFDISKVKESILLPKKEKYIFNYCVLSTFKFPKELNLYILELYINQSTNLLKLKQDELLFLSLEIMMAKLYNALAKKPLALFESEKLNTTIDNAANYIVDNIQAVCMDMFQHNTDFLTKYITEEDSEEIRKIPYQQIKKIHLSIKPIMIDVLAMFPIQYKQVAVDWIKCQTVLNSKRKYMNHIIIN